jgi:uncharacterized membrane protein YdbT with pleckstrin-like domain
MSDETILYQARPSWLYYYALYCIGVIVAALFHQVGDLEAAGLVVLVFVGIVMVFRFRHLFTITSDRIIARVGLIARNTNEIQLRHIRAVSVRQGVIERILGVGTLTFLSAAEGVATVVFKGVRDPIGLKERIRCVQEGQ